MVSMSLMVNKLFKIANVVVLLLQVATCSKHGQSS